MDERNYIEKFIENNKSIQENFLNFLEDKENIEENYKKLNLFFEDIKIRDCKHELKQFLYMLLKISNNHYRFPDFFRKICQILLLFKDDIKKFSNTEIFSLFKSNKRILLFLIEEKILTVDKYFITQITKKKYLEKNYPQYFAPEIKPFADEEWFPKYKKKEEEEEEIDWVEEIKKELPPNFYELRNFGENDSYLCELIREDSIQDFISYITKSHIPYNTKINTSIYETNSFLIKKQRQAKKGISLIEYAAFFGSIKIFNFLKNEGIELTQSLWLYAIHSKNSKLIHILEDNDIIPTITVLKGYREVEVKSYKKLFYESMKCHHNDIANYFLYNYLQTEDENSIETISQSLKYYNFSFILKEYINESSFCHLCHFDYYSIVKVFLTNNDVDINSKII